MPDEQGNTQIEEEEIPETPLHAHGSGLEAANERDREEQVEGETNEDGDPDASEVENTGGARSGGPGGEAEGEDDPANG